MPFRESELSSIEDRAITTIKILALDAIEKANSGHPGMCMGAADAAFVLWTKFLCFDPDHPEWPNRDRFILSAGHASMLLYSLLHLSGYDVTIEDIKRFRQFGSKTPGHPEYGHTPGVEVTTGPLGQGFAHAVGMALGGKMLQARFNREGYEIINYRVFVLCGDGDMMEGVTYESASLAGHLGLDNLVVVYDSNKITIEGSTGLAFSESVRGRFESCGWIVREVDGYDRNGLEKAITELLCEPDRPGLVISHSEIGHGAPTMHGQPRTHGAPLGREEVQAYKSAVNWTLDKDFYCPDDVREYFRMVADRGREKRRIWEKVFEEYRKSYGDLAKQWDTMIKRDYPDDLADRLYRSAVRAKGGATRATSSYCLQEAYKLVPGLIGGSADLGPSNETIIKEAPHCIPEKGRERFLGVNLHFGVREHAMAGIVNGLALTKMFRPFGATFLVFADYMKPSLRLSALMRCPSIFVFTHDSFGVGEDGPTHQPIEQLFMLRSIPNFVVFRPADPLEVASAWFYALKLANGPVAICLTRQKIPPFERPSDQSIEDCLLGGYILRDCEKPDFIFIATGSEVPLVLSAQEILEEEGISARVVSMPSIELFLSQSEEYQRKVLPRGIRVVTVEAGVTIGWHRFAGKDGLTIGIDHFGDSAPQDVLAKKYGFTKEAIAERVKRWFSTP